MNSYCVIIDSRRGYSRLENCLIRLAQAARNISGSVASVLITDKARSRFTKLAEQHAARLLTLPPGTRGRHYNTAANIIPAEVLIFIDPAAELREDWLLHVDQVLSSQRKDAIAMLREGPAIPAWLGRLCHMDSRIQALCIQRTWFERVGGFDEERNTGAERDLMARLTACRARVLEFSTVQPRRELARDAQHSPH